MKVDRQALVQAVNKLLANAGRPYGLYCMVRAVDLVNLKDALPKKVKVPHSVFRYW